MKQQYPDHARLVVALKDFLKARKAEQNARKAEENGKRAEKNAERAAKQAANQAADQARKKKKEEEAQKKEEAVTQKELRRKRREYEARKDRRIMEAKDTLGVKKFPLGQVLEAYPSMSPISAVGAYVQNQLLKKKQNKREKRELDALMTNRGMKKLPKGLRERYPEMSILQALKQYLKNGANTKEKKAEEKKITDEMLKEAGMGKIRQDDILWIRAQALHPGSQVGAVRAYVQLDEKRQRFGDFELTENGKPGAYIGKPLDVRVLKRIVDRLQELKPGEKKVTKSMALRAYVAAKRRKARKSSGRFFNFDSNEFLPGDGGKAIPGKEFVKAYADRRKQMKKVNVRQLKEAQKSAKAHARAERRNSKSSNSRTSTNTYKSASTTKSSNSQRASPSPSPGRRMNSPMPMVNYDDPTYGNSTLGGLFTTNNEKAALENAINATYSAPVIEEAKRLAPLRTRLDAALLTRFKIPARLTPTSKRFDDFPNFLKALFSYEGPLEKRPLLGGNVGQPNNVLSSPIKQLENQGQTDGCTVGRSWAGRQGASLHVYQGVLFALANLRAREFDNASEPQRVRLLLDGNKGALKRGVFERVMALQSEMPYLSRHEALERVMKIDANDARLAAASRDELSNLASVPPGPSLLTPGLLALWSVGSGKTLAGVASLVSFWNCTFVDKNEVKPVGIFPVSVRSNQAGNNVLEYARLAALCFPWFRSTCKGIKVEYPFASGVGKAMEAIKKRLELGYVAMGAKGSIAEDHVLGSFATVARDFFGYGSKRGYLKDNEIAKNCVFIVDEIQLLFSPPSSESAFVREYGQMRHLFMSRRDPATTWVVGLTATPGETRDDVANVLRCVAGKEHGFLTPTSIEKEAHGLVSYAYVAGDKTRFATATVKHECIPLPLYNSEKYGNYYTRYLSKLAELPETRDAVLKIAMTKGYAAIQQKIIEASEKKKAQQSNAPREPNPQEIFMSGKKMMFFKKVRKLSEFLKLTVNGRNKDLIMKGMVQVNEGDEDENNTDSVYSHENDSSEKVTPEEREEILERARAFLDKQANDAQYPVIKEVTPTKFASLPDARGFRMTKTIDRYSYYILSPKLIGIIESILMNDGVHYVYSLDRMSLRLIAHVLGARHGYQQYSYQDGLTLDDRRYGYINPAEPIKGQLWDPVRQEYVKQYKTSSKDIAALLGGMVGTQKTGGALRDPANANGGICRVVLAHADSYKGVNLNFIRHVHCVTTLPSYIDMLQLQGRGPRACGHAGLPAAKRNVTFHIWKLTGGEVAASCPKDITARVFPDCFLFDRALKAYLEGYGSVEEALVRVSVDNKLFTAFTRQAQKLKTEMQAGCIETRKEPALRSADRKWEKRKRELLAAQRKKAKLSKKAAGQRKKGIEVGRSQLQDLQDAENQFQKLQLSYNRRPQGFRTPTGAPKQVNRRNLRRD